LGGFVGLAIAQAVFVAGVVVVAANWAFVVILFRRGKADASTRLVTRFYLGEILKLVLTAILLAVAVSVFSIAPLPLLITYFMLQIILWPIGMMEVSKGFL
jgi:ATP synthase protein I